MSAENRGAAGWQLHFRKCDWLPKLAWLADVDVERKTVTVNHGRAVEQGPTWCVEGVWERPFEEGSFHLVENFFGSGVRVDEGELVFASSAAIVDRLVHVAWRGRLIVSNSLIQVLARTGAALQPEHDYSPETFASRYGIHSYPSAIRVSHPEFAVVHQEYHCNLSVHGSQLRRAVRSMPRHFGSFDAYRDALLECLRRIRANYESPKREHPVTPFCTTSSGYDSAAASALAKQVGVKATFTTEVDPTAEERQRESGAPVARALGLEVRTIGIRGRDVTDLERYFLAGCIDGSEIFYHDLAVDLEGNRGIGVLFTGYYGDTAWDRGDGPPAFSDDMRRKDVAGLNLSEVRLKAGFINLPVPQIYGRNLGDIVAISQSEEMRAWSVRPKYDRPIPRRIVESAGVARAVFGQEKHAQMLYYNEPRSPELRREFLSFLGEEAGISRVKLAAHDFVKRIDYGFSKLLGTKSLLSGRTPNMRGLMFVWATNSLAREFSSFYERA